MMKQKINIFALERFYFTEATRQRDMLTSPVDIFNFLNSPLRWTVKELFSDLLDREKSGEVFEFSVRDFIYRYADDYLDIYDSAVKRCYRDYVKLYKKPKYMEPEGTKLISVSDAAKLLGLTENAIRYKMNQGHISVYRSEQGVKRVDEIELINKYLTFKKD